MNQRPCQRIFNKCREETNLPVVNSLELEPINVHSSCCTAKLNIVHHEAARCVQCCVFDSWFAAGRRKTIKFS